MIIPAARPGDATPSPRIGTAAGRVKADSNTAAHRNPDHEPETSHEL